MRVIAACLRHVTAVSSWLVARGYGTPEHPVPVIAAGERWPEGSLRPALEDLLGAGALISELCCQGCGPALRGGGRRLAAMGFVGDVAIATEEDVCTVVPVRDGDGAFARG
ncbi:hypothetical protein AB0I54_12975 [Streptomyces sp. NPDC050625]|uniref:hypothetical protein n=1 Tax=Streptomyces sp. NPDC050625 TaxID=3154629 RepID=UPI0034215E1A